MDLRRFNILLLVVGIALGVVLAALLVQGDEPAPGDSEAEQLRQQRLDVTRAAAAQVQAFLGVDHENVEQQAQIVLDGATGAFKQQYAEELDSLVRSARAQESTARSSVLQVGISDLEDGAATVFVAADTEVTSNATDGDSRTVPWRIRLDMVEEDGRWLTSGLQFVG